MLERNIDALLAGELADNGLEPVGAVIDDMIGAERPRFLDLGIVADRGEDGAAYRLCHPDGGRADAGAAGLHQDAFARLELGVVEQHVLDGGEGDRRASGVAKAHARRHCDDEPCRHVDPIASKAIDVETHHAADIFAQIVTALAAGLADAARQRAVGDDPVAGLKRIDARSNRDDLARRLGADHERQLALGERHAAPAPHIDVVEADGPDRDLDFARAGSRRRRGFKELDLAVAKECERAHRPLCLRSGGSGWGIPRAVDRWRDAGHAGSRASTRQTFWPPKPNELEMARRMRLSRATLGTTSSGIAGSGMS